MLVDIVKGDLIELFDNGVMDVIAHGCNTEIPMGRGIAKSIVDRWPIVGVENDNFRRRWELAVKEKGLRPILRRFCGVVREVPIEGDRICGEDGLILNAYTQIGVGYPKTGEDRLAYIGECFEVINALYKDISGVVGIPKIGSGLARGDWSKIRKVIDANTPHVDILLVEND